VQDIERVQLGYEQIKLLNKITEDEPDEGYFVLLEQAFAALDDSGVSLRLIECWFYAQLLRQGGFTPNLGIDVAGEKLDASKRYLFNFDESAFLASEQGNFTADHIKFLRLLFSPNQPKTLQKVQRLTEVVPNCLLVTRTMLHQHLNV
jgi:recombinational DNA repair protein (RecF pathway)